MEFSQIDKTSYSNTEDFVIEKSHFNWKIDFENEQISGSVTHKVKVINSSSKKLIFDVNNLNIKKICIDNETVSFQYIDGVLGGKLIIPLELNTKTSEFEVFIEYNTTKEGTALLWMKPEMTMGKKHSFVYSQCQAIHARSLYPCQDTPFVKATYTATVEAPKNLEVVMSAVRKSSKLVEGVKQYTFEQNIPIASYLVAIACGNLVGCKIGPRSTVYSEPEINEKAKWEFEAIEQILVLAEELCGPYEWGVCDLLILPPSFPYGGMENPCIIFLSSCLLTGDRSQINYIAHEIAHSWTGNLVTNSNWDHFWVNEGHTNYLERLILEKLQSSEPYRHLHIIIGISELEEALDMFFKFYGPNHEFTKLVPNLYGIDPDDAFSRVPYEKGSFLLFYLEKLIGKDKMLRWLKKYIATFRLKSISTDEWKSFFFQYMIENESVNLSLLDKIDWDTWFYKPGKIPIDHKPLVIDSMIIECNELADLWIVGSHQSLPDENELCDKFFRLLPDQKYYLFQILNNIKKSQLPESSLKLMGHIYGLTNTWNSELLYGWSLLCLQSHYEPAVDQIFEFINSQGRLKYNKVIYKYLCDWEVTRSRARENFDTYSSSMHPVTRGEIQKIVYPD